VYLLVQREDGELLDCSLNCFFERLVSFSTIILAPAPAPIADVASVNSTDDITDTDAAASAASLLSKRALELSGLLARNLLRGNSALPWTTSTRVRVLQLLPVLVVGSAHADPEISKACLDACVTVSMSVEGVSAYRTHTTPFTSNNVSSSGSAVEAEGGRLLTGALHVFSSLSTHSSLHVRKCCLVCCSMLMVVHWQVLDARDRKCCRDVFTSGVVDSRPELQMISTAGMVSQSVFIHILMICRLFLY
jgi:hypothetical protein